MRLELQRHYLHTMGVQVWQKKINSELPSLAPTPTAQASTPAAETPLSKAMFSIRADINTQEEDALLNNILQAIGQNRAMVSLEPLKADINQTAITAVGIIFGQHSVVEGLTAIPHTLAEIIAQPSLKRVIWQSLQTQRSH